MRRLLAPTHVAHPLAAHLLVAALALLLLSPSLLAQRVVRADLAISPDGTLAATSTGTGVLLLWNLPAWTIRHRYAGNGARLFGFDFSTDSRVVAFGSNDGRITVLDVASGEVVFDVQDRPGSVSATRFGPAPDTSGADAPDALLFAAGQGRLLTSYAWRTGEARRSYDLGRDTMPNGDPLIVEDFDVIPARGTLFIARFDGQARLMDIETGEVVHTWANKTRPRDGGRNVKDVAATPDGRTGFFSGVGGEVIAVDLVTGTRRDSVRVHPDFVSHLDISPDGQRLAALDLDGTTSLLDPAAFGTPDVLVRRMQQTASFSSRRLLFAGTFRPGTNQFVTGGIQLPLIVWDAATGERLRTIATIPD